MLLLMLLFLCCSCCFCVVDVHVLPVSVLFVASPVHVVTPPSVACVRVFDSLFVRSSLRSFNSSLLLLFLFLFLLLFCLRLLVVLFMAFVVLFMAVAVLFIIGLFVIVCMLPFVCCCCCCW